MSGQDAEMLSLLRTAVLENASRAVRAARMHNRFDSPEFRLAWRDLEASVMAHASEIASDIYAEPNKEHSP